MDRDTYIVRRNDAADHEIDVFDDYRLAAEFADAVDGYVTDEPILQRDDTYVQIILQGDDASYVCDACGTQGNADDGISGDGDECPDEDCPGNVHIITKEE